jgi:cholesterol transport system auxiliary component
MTPLLRAAAPLALALAVGGCSLGSLLGGGGKTPPWLLSLTPEAPAPASLARAANAGEAVTINVPIIAKELRTTRVPAQVGPTAVQYLENIAWVDTPDRLFKDLLAETVRRRTSRVVLDSRQSGLDPGLVVSGQLHRFGYDEAAQAVVVRYDGALSTQGGTRVETRRFEASVPSTADAASIGPALNRAANQVALEAASWIGG